MVGYLPCPTHLIGPTCKSVLNRASGMRTSDFFKHARDSTAIVFSSHKSRGSLTLGRATGTISDMPHEFVEDGPKAVPWDEYKSIVQREWRELLEREGTGEEDFHKFLERHPCLIPGCDAFTGAAGWSNPASSINGCVVSEPLLPGISNRYPDFMWAPTDSQTQWIVLIEIEDPKKPWFTQNFQQRAELTQALDQIAQWRAHLKKPENLLALLRLYDIPSRPIEFVYCLVYGRRRDVSSRVGTEKRNALLSGLGDFKWMTYDRLRPDEDARNIPCVKVSAAEKLTAVTFPPTTRIDLWSVRNWAEVNEKRKAIFASPHFSEPRQRFLADRLDYWDKVAATSGIRIGHDEYFKSE
jgi:Shedu protein SduA, C-terminal